MGEERAEQPVRGTGEIVELQSRRKPRSGVAFEPPLPPEDRLRDLFRQEAELEGKLAKVRADLGIARRAYADKHNLLALPGIDHLRRIFSL